MFLSKGGVWDAFAVCGVCFPGKQRSADIFISVYHTIYNCGSKKLRIVLFCDTGNEVGHMELFWTQITDAQPAFPARSKAHGSAWGVSLLAYAVRAVWGIALPETAELPGGKPYFPACPQLHFSVSHTRTAALVAVSVAPVGADVEQVRPLHPAMARRLAQADCGDLQPFELWTLRESWFKLTGAGDLRTIPFRRAAGVLVPPEAGALCRVYDGIPGCMAAVCSLAERPPERLQFVPPREICICT